MSASCRSTRSDAARKLTVALPIALALAAGVASPAVQERPVAAEQHAEEAPTQGHAAVFAGAVRELTRLPYQPAYLPTGIDRAFAPAVVPNAAPAEDYTSGSVPGSPDSPSYPQAFHRILLNSPDGARFFAWVGLHDSPRPGVEVVHGFNTNAAQSVVRWAAMLYANGYDVIAADQRDFAAEYQAGYDAGHPQTFGWRESQDVLAAGAYLASRPAVLGPIGLVGFSEGAQNAVLALANDASQVYGAALTFSGPADQDTQIYTTAVPPGCRTPACTYPATAALVTLVVPPYTYTDPCQVLTADAAAYRTTGFAILARESAMHVQDRVHVPLLTVYAADDPLVAPLQAQMMAAYQSGNRLQRTLLIRHGAHAYFYDRWWQQQAILDYFRALLPAARRSPGVTALPTVDQTPGGASLESQLVPVATMDRGAADAKLAPYICNTAAGRPGALANQARRR